MNPYGPHTALVQEVINFVDGGQLLHGGFQIPDQCSWEIRTTDVFDDEFIEKCRDCDVPDALINDWLWIDIKAQDNARFHAAELHDQFFTDEIWPRIQAQSTRLYSVIADSLRHILPPVEIAEIDGDLYTIMLERSVGITDPILQRLFSVYKAGGYPCGWSGRYPEGELLVFVRS